LRHLETFHGSGVAGPAGVKEHRANARLFQPPSASRSDGSQLAHLAGGDGLVHHLKPSVRASHPPLRATLFVEAFAQIRLIVRMEFTGQMQADLVHITPAGYIKPSMVSRGLRG